jgi:hypothetical protein
MRMMQPDVVERVKRMAEKARNEATPVARDWWVVNGVEVFFHPPQTADEVRNRWYPGAGVVPREA